MHGRSREGGLRNKSKKRLRASELTKWEHIRVLVESVLDLVLTAQAFHIMQEPNVAAAGVMG